MTLDPIQLRVLGALIEKEITTPENYPLSLNALMAACNQRSSRDPVLDLTEDEVRQAVHSLEDAGILAPVRDARVPKYEHRIRTILNLRRDETALLCLLMLRGPQTPGELRGRADRMYSFEDLAAVQATLERLANRSEAGGGSGLTSEGVYAVSGPLVVMLPRQPGSRESRFAHLLGGPVAATAVDASRPVHASRDESSSQAVDEAAIETRIEARIEARIAERFEFFASRIATLEARVDALEKNKL
jgi:uncharacterized protein YceH (UPF0502 family)